MGFDLGFLGHLDRPGPESGRVGSRTWYATDYRQLANSSEARS